MNYYDSSFRSVNNGYNLLLRGVTGKFGVQYEQPLGNNLTLREDVIGLRAHLETSDPEVVRLAKEKRLRGWSFDIKRPVENRAETPGGLPIRTITDFDISEVSLVSDRLRPWYESTTVETRAGEGEEEITELRAEEFDPDYIGFEKEKEKPDNSKLKKIIERYGGNV